MERYQKLVKAIIAGFNSSSSTYVFISNWVSAKILKKKYICEMGDDFDQVIIHAAVSTALDADSS